MPAGYSNGIKPIVAQRMNISTQESKQLTAGLLSQDVLDLDFAFMVAQLTYGWRRLMATGISNGHRLMVVLSGMKYAILSRQQTVGLPSLDTPNPMGREIVISG